MTRHLQGWLACEVCLAKVEAEMIAGEEIYPLHAPEGWAVRGFLYRRDLCPRCLSLNPGDQKPRGWTIPMPILLGVAVVIFACAVYVSLDALLTLVER